MDRVGSDESMQNIMDEVAALEKGGFRTIDEYSQRLGDLLAIKDGLPPELQVRIDNLSMR